MKAKSGTGHGHGLVHALRDMVDAQETSGDAKRWLGQGVPLPSSIRDMAAGRSLATWND